MGSLAAYNTGARTKRDHLLRVEAPIGEIALVVRDHATAAFDGRPKPNLEASVRDVVFVRHVLVLRHDALQDLGRGGEWHIADEVLIGRRRRERERAMPLEAGSWPKGRPAGAGEGKVWHHARVQIVSIEAEPLLIPLIEPFTISRASVGSTRAAEVRARVRRGDEVAEGLGEAALPLGSDRTPEDLIGEVGRAAEALSGRACEDPAAITLAVDTYFDGSMPARSALHCALLDGWARLSGKPIYEILGGAEVPAPLVTDITLPIADARHLAELATGYLERGFSCFKIKVGADLAADKEVVRLVAEVAPRAALRFDANMGFEAHEALALLAHASQLGMVVECFEQPCARDDLAGLRAVRASGVPVVADESVASEADLDQLVAAGAVDGVNLKLVKMGGIDRALAIGRRARDAGLGLMVGAMIESRLGLTAMAHVAAALGGVEWVDLDTAFLLREDPWRGGMEAAGASLTLPRASGLGVSPRPLRATAV